MDNNSLLAVDGVHITPVSMDIPEGLLESDWEEIGKKLGRFDTTYQWMVGDWWNFGEGHYKNKRDRIEKPDWHGPTYQACMNCGWIAKRFKVSVRTEMLSYKHYERLAPLMASDPKMAKEIINWCVQPLKDGKKKPKSVAAMMKEINRRFNPRVQLAEKKEQSGKDPNLSMYIDFFAPIDQLAEGEWDLKIIGSVPTGLLKELLDNDMANCRKAIKLIRGFLKEVESTCLINQSKD
jgi:hypothetical protein